MRYLNQGGKLDAILEEAQEIATHLLHREQWLGISADQSGDDWALRGTLNPFVLLSGIGDWGAWGKIIGPDDTPIVSGTTLFSVDRILITDVDVLTPYILQFAWGASGDAGVSAGDVTDFMYVSSTDNPSKAGGGPGKVLMPRIAAGTKVWARVKCATADTMDFFIGAHGHNA